MKILITASSGDLNSPVDMRFARAPYLIIADSENKNNTEIIQNPFVNTPSGAGIAAAQFAVEKGVQVVISGAFGPNSSMILSSSGIQMITENTGISVNNALEKIDKGEYSYKTEQQNYQYNNSYGMNYPIFNPFVGAGGFMGGFGWGKGFGRGWGWNRGFYNVGVPLFPQQSNIYNEKELLKNMIGQLENQLEIYKNRLDKLEKNNKEEK
jgi:predicted Fe-Mo cluster-binding NifX family protein